MKNYLTRIKKEARKNVYRRGAGGGGGWAVLLISVNMVVKISNI